MESFPFFEVIMFVPKTESKQIQRVYRQQCPKLATDSYRATRPFPSNDSIEIFEFESFPGRKSVSGIDFEAFEYSVSEFWDQKRLNESWEIYEKMADSR